MPDYNCFRFYVFYYYYYYLACRNYWEKHGDIKGGAFNLTKETWGKGWLKGCKLKTAHGSVVYLNIRRLCCDTRAIMQEPAGEKSLYLMYKKNLLDKTDQPRALYTPKCCNSVFILSLSKVKIYIINVYT